MLVSSYKLKQAFRSPSITADKKGNISFTTYKEGSTVKGYFKAKDVLAKDSPFIDLVITTDGYAIPANVVTKIKDLYDDETGEQLDVSEADNKIVSDIQKIANNTYVKELSNKANYSVRGAMFGAVGGLVFAAFKGKSVIVFSLLGAFAGGLIGKYFANHATGINKEVSKAENVVKDTKETIAKKRDELRKKAKQVEQKLNS